jgi:hypothetical protein
MRRFKLFSWGIIVLLLTACFRTDADTSTSSEEKYTFRAIHDPEATNGLTIAGLQIPSFNEKMRELANSGRYAEYLAASRGALLQLFGEPLETSDRSEEAYVYLVEATDQLGKKWILMPVLGSILGDPDDQSVIPVAEALLHLMETTKPADFETIVYDDDTNNTATYGCKNGKCYWHEIPGKHLP